MSPDTDSPDTDSPDTVSPDTESPDTESPDIRVQTPERNHRAVGIRCLWDLVIGEWLSGPHPARGTERGRGVNEAVEETADDGGVG